MRLTKYQHACFTVELDGQTLLVDPGNLTTDLDEIVGLTAVVITHQHADHYDKQLLDSLLEDEVPIYAEQTVLTELGLPTSDPVDPGDVIEIGPFRLEFFGGEHATIHRNIPGLANLGVIINDTVCYPGDSFASPDATIDTLLLPVAAPWMKIAEAIDYVNQVEPRLAVPTHDAILSTAGQEIADRVVASNLVPGIDYQRLDGSIDL